MSHLFRHLGREIGIQVPISRISYYKWMGQIFVLHRLVKENYFSLFTLTDFTLIYYILGFFLVLWKPLLVCFCVVVWVLFSIFWIFCIKPFGYCTRAQHQEIIQFLDQCVILKRLCAMIVEQWPWWNTSHL